MSKFFYLQLWPPALLQPQNLQEYKSSHLKFLIRDELNLYYRKSSLPADVWGKRKSAGSEIRANWNMGFRGPPETLILLRLINYTWNHHFHHILQKNLLLSLIFGGWDLILQLWLVLWNLSIQLIESLKKSAGCESAGSETAGGEDSL